MRGLRQQGYFSALLAPEGASSCAPGGEDAGYAAHAAVALGPGGVVVAQPFFVAAWVFRGALGHCCVLAGHLACVRIELVTLHAQQLLGALAREVLEGSGLVFQAVSPVDSDDGLRDEAAIVELLGLVGDGLFLSPNALPQARCSAQGVFVRRSVVGIGGSAQVGLCLVSVCFLLHVHVCILAMNYAAGYWY